MNNEVFKDEIIIGTLERTIRRLWILCIILILLLTATNAAWIYYESQFEEIKTTTEIDAEQSTEDSGNNTIIGGDYGSAESEN